ncbi:MAG: ATP-binding protein [Marinilabiliales bacterium]
MYSASVLATEKVDSLLNKLNNVKETEIVQVYTELGDVLSKIKPLNAINYYKQALVNLQEQESDISEEIPLLLKIAKNYRSIGDYTYALEYLDKVLELAMEKDDKDVIMDAYNEMAINYFHLNKYDTSIKYFKKYIGLLEEKLDKENLSIAYNNIANIYRVVNDYSKAFDYLNQAEQFLIELGDSVALANTLNNKALLYQDKKDYFKAWEYFYRAESIADKFDDFPTRINIYGNIANLAFEQKNYPLAKTYFNKIIKYALKINNHQILSDVYRQMSELYEIEGDNKSALDYFKLHTLHKDSVIQSRNDAQINELKVLYDVDKKVHENKILKQENSIQKLQNQKQKNIIVFAIVILLLVISVVIILINRFRIIKKHNRILEDKNKEIEKVNKQLKVLNKDLEEKVKERTIELSNEIKDKIEAEKKVKEALKAAQKANLIKDNFLSNISHEVRTPLNAILGLSALLENKLENINDEDIKIYLKGIKESSNRLLHLINNIIDLSTFQAQELDIENISCDIKAIIENVISLFEFKINEKGLQLNNNIPDDLPPIQADCKYISRVLYDVFDNAVKYTDKGSIKIEVEDYNELNEICIVISDTGVGISPAFLPHVFDSFSQEQEGYSRNYQGAGLGLPLAKKLVEMMGGRIEISSSKGKGTIVRITLRYAVEDNINQPLSIEDSYISDEILKESGIEILIVEDDSFNAIVLEEILSRISKPVIVDNPDRALEIVKEYKSKNKYFNLFLIDINLPGNMDGIELMHKIKEIDSKYNHIPFIAQTAYAMSSDREKLLKSGFDDYVAKPIDQDEFMQIIKSKLV